MRVFNDRQSCPVSFNVVAMVMMYGDPLRIDRPLIGRSDVTFACGMGSLSRRCHDEGKRKR